MNDTERIRLSKFLSYALRHAPAEVGVALDANGWADVDDLLSACNAHGPGATREEVAEVVRRCDKQRFTFDVVSDRIRATHGHSVDVDLGLTKCAPPAILYHGTHAGAVTRILAEGLRPMQRQHVHLSADVETAMRVGARRGRPALLEVEAGRMHAEGAEFFVSASGVWLTSEVPPWALRIR